ncbi:response regulator transcription factor [Actinokineospora soli]|uniref:Response regulator transcription factor n=1 Tax=Actinokineospora soli TaxID=1048753 RepID=A0ABW2TRA3_9PSEU
MRAGGRVVDRSLHPLLADHPADTGISDRQRSVLELIAMGHSNSAIADRLGVSTETIRTHVKALLVRLAARDRAHAVARGYQQGILLATPGE